MAIPLFVLRNENTRNFKRRVLLENLSEFEVKKHTGLPWAGATDVINWLGPQLEPKALTNRAVGVETKILTALGYFRSGGFQWLMGSDLGTSQPTCSRIIAEVKII